MSFVSENWQILTGLVASVVTFFSGFKLKKINEKKEGATALESIQKVYDIFTVQTNRKFDELYMEVAALKKENHEQRGLIRDLQKDNSSLHREVSKLMQKNNQLLLENQELKFKHKTPAP